MERGRKNSNKFSLRKQHSALAPLTDRERYNLNDDDSPGTILGLSDKEKDEIKAENYRNTGQNIDEKD
tara:strand:- start:1028 stop:1231 length:204 start_codon:yes stop_codon:yes gene_type:complete